MAALTVTSGKEVGRRDTDAGGRGRQFPLGLLDVRTPLQQLDRRSRRSRGRHGGDQVRLGEFLHHVLRVFADQHGERVLRGPDLRFDRGDLALQRGQLAACERHVELVGDAPLIADVDDPQRLAQHVARVVQYSGADLESPQVHIGRTTLPITEVSTS